MIRLSKKGWNNVLIFSMMLMIMVFNGLHKKIQLGETEWQAVSVLPEDSLVLTLSLGDIVIERIGQGWRTNQPVGMDNDALTALMLNWKRQQASWHEESSEAKVLTAGQMPRHYVIATLAGKTDGAVYAFYPTLEDVWIHDQYQKRWLKAPLAVMDSLIPEPFHSKTPEQD